MTRGAQFATREASGRWHVSVEPVPVEDPASMQGDSDLILPALANAHDHGRGLRTAAFGAGDDALEVWIAALGREPATEPYLRAAVAFARLARAGVGVLNHCHNSADPARLVEEAEAVSRAARDVGVRVAFAAPVMGRNPLAYGDPRPLLARLPEGQAAMLQGRGDRGPSQSEQLEMTEAVAAFEHDLFQVQYGPVGPQWVDDDILAEIARRSRETGRRVHMHLFETRYQKEWAEAAYPGGLLARLDEMGLLSNRLTVAHGVYLDDADCALLAARDVFVSVNASSNLRLRSGLPPIARFLKHGVRFGLGMDGMGFDDDEDALRELRVAWRLSRGWGTIEDFSRDQLLDAALITGRQAILGAETPEAQDYLVLDTTRITSDVVDPEVDLLDLVIGRARTEDVRTLCVNGRNVVHEGRATGIDQPAAEAELLAQARVSGPLAADPELTTLKTALADYYACGCHRNLYPVREPTS